ncbi:enoyl-CoA hydratase/isomerase family protein [Arsenicitalea aurantiaca]|uniref:Enoyl-CoA hydratase/isomerase family protein n=1 Tax=Arsenicitalea aurantiaca TaxID=1783274 RepID=A0A433XEJ8_9HYPH|nr:enoyl-CoA hydratase-related protein [Arsenicitalea aurantiaca]RUT32502.1 enoyl-CoA hydratase/isomerase family protein [Arsenicitalea aurantiaca]
MAYETLTVEQRGRVALVTFRRADQLNAMNRLMQSEITTAFEALSLDPGIGAIVVTGEGRGFMAGADIKEYAAQTGPEFDAFQQNGGRMYAAIENNAKPVIAAVNGFALGGGFELVLCCDIVIASETAKMGLPEIKLGLIPGGGGTQRSVGKLGRNRAHMLLMTGAIMPAAEFVVPGLVNELLAPDAVLPRAIEIAGLIADEPPAAIEGMKALTALALEGDLESGLVHERDLVTALYRSQIGQQRVQEFAAKSAARAAEKAKAAAASGE